MVYYAIAFALTMILSMQLGAPHYSLQGVRTNTFQRMKTAWIVLLPLIFLALFRWNVGADSLYGSSYWEAYHHAADGINSRNMEAGFYWFMRIFAELEIPFFWFLFAHGLLFFVIVSYALHIGSKWESWSVALFFLLTVYFDSYSSLRQSIAEAICLVGWAKMGVEKEGIKKDISIILLFLTASLFHSTGLLNVPIYLLCKFRFRRQADVLIFALIAVAMTPVLQKIIPIVMNALSTNENYTTLGLARINIAVMGLFFLLTWLFYNEISGNNQYGYMYVNQALIMFIIILNSGAMYLPYRVYDMLKIGYIFIIPQVVGSISEAKNRFLVQIAFACVCIATFVNFVIQPNNIYMNYQTVFSDWWNIINLP
nr:EpsG family protein [Clostridia bacterium]